MKQAFALAALGLVAACAATSNDDAFVDKRPPTEALLYTIAMQPYRNAEQMAALPDGTATAYTADTPWVDEKCAYFLPAKVPAAKGKRAIFLQWQSGTCEGEVSRQRVWSFEDGDEPGTALMYFYSLKEGALDTSLSAAENAKLAAKLTADDLIGYPPGCEVVWRRTGDTWAGKMKSGCEIVAQRSGRTMVLDAEITAQRDITGLNLQTIAITDTFTLTYRESGQLEDGNYAFEVPGDTSYEFVATSVSSPK